ncbi:MAG: ABC transporter [Acidobacteria bacterium]|nr:MAG: ABC transporter [Acidobacteriota bacterium]
MGISLKPDRLKRYKDVAMLLIKYGRSDLISQAGLEESVLPEEMAVETAASAEELAKDLERLGPTFIKLGQLLSTRADLLPTPYLDALAKLQDQIDPISYEEVERIVSGELGVRISKAFAEFETTPLAAASLAQVHRAYMRDGRAVVVKVQRPNIRELIADDLDALLEIAHFLDTHTELGRRYEFENMLFDLRKSLLRELDFTTEARNLNTISRNLSEFENIIVPEPIEDYTTTRILTMEYLPGKKVTSLNPLRLLEINGSELADELFRAYLKQLLIDGLFHADPHPGNVFLTDDNCIALLDLGMVGHVTSSFQDNLLRLLLSIAEGRGEMAAESAIKMGEAKEGFDRNKFTNRIVDLVAENSDAVLSRANAGVVTLEITKISAECWFRLPSQFTMIAKALMNLDRVVYVLDPGFDPNAVIREEAQGILERNILRSLAPANLMSGAVDLKEFTEKLPTRVNKILDAVGDNKLRFKVDAIDEKVVLDGLQKVANRITLGLVVASLIVGAAMLMRVETTFKILGYPGIAMILFILAAVAGLMLALSILLYDKKTS